MRLFIGIPLVAATADALAIEVARLRAKTPADFLRWSAGESWHITLQFLGSTKPEQYECLVAELRKLRHTPVVIRLGALGIFDRAGILYVDVHVTPELVSLQRTVVAATTPCGYAPEDRPYHPHITLARRKGKRGHELRNLKLQTLRPGFPGFTAESFLLYESVATPEGSRYEVRERFALQNGRTSENALK
jgi:RNA 2',3'-cyclic 3'-phosphodiesterase